MSIEERRLSDIQRKFELDKYEGTGMTVEETHHPEFGSSVFQPRVAGFDKFIEPYVYEREAWAFLDGVSYAKAEAEELCRKVLEEVQQG